MKVSHKYEYPKYLTQSFSMDEERQEGDASISQKQVIKEGSIESEEDMSMEIPEEIPSQ